MPAHIVLYIYVFLYIFYILYYARNSRPSYTTPIPNHHLATNLDFLNASPYQNNK